MNQLSQQGAGEYHQSAAPSMNQLSQQGPGEYHQSAAPIYEPVISTMCREV